MNNFCSFLKNIIYYLGTQPNQSNLILTLSPKLQTKPHLPPNHFLPPIRFCTRGELPLSGYELHLTAQSPLSLITLNHRPCSLRLRDNKAKESKTKKKAKKKKQLCEQRWDFTKCFLKTVLFVSPKRQKNATENTS